MAVVLYLAGCLKASLCLHLQANDDEWVEHPDGTFQNKRCGEIFKQGKDGDAYTIRGIVFIDQNGFAFTDHNSKVFIEFPYVVPDEPEYRNVVLDEDEIRNDKTPANKLITIEGEVE